MARCEYLLSGESHPLPPSAALSEALNRPFAIGAADPGRGVLLLAPPRSPSGGRAGTQAPWPAAQARRRSPPPASGASGIVSNAMVAREEPRHLTLTTETATPDTIPSTAAPTVSSSNVANPTPVPDDTRSCNRTHTARRSKLLAANSIEAGPSGVEVTWFDPDPTRWLYSVT